MIDFDFKQECCGCTACISSCKFGAIAMLPDEEGFLMPWVDKDKCVGCGLCDKICPYLDTPLSEEDISRFSLEDFKEKKAFLYFSNNEDRKQSASGGFVYEAMKDVVARGGLACGCVWNEKMEAVHIVSDKKEDLQRMQSSKYVQSDMQDSFVKIRHALKAGRTVVFCGTPCQTAGLNSFLKKEERSHLILISLICHGVPSPGVWEKWKTIVEQKYGGELVDVNMRDKSYKGYSTSYCKYTFKSAFRTEGKKSGHASHECGNLNSTYLADCYARNVGMPTYLADPYIFLFTNDLYLRHSCYHCKYKAERNGADIIVGDYYKSVPEAGNMGCSCLIAMTKKGEAFIETVSGSLIPSDYVTVGSVNSMLWKSVREHPRRENFFERYQSTVIPDMTIFTDFLPIRFHIKKMLNYLGIFNALRKHLKKA